MEETQPTASGWRALRQSARISATRPSTVSAASSITDSSSLMASTARGWPRLARSSATAFLPGPPVAVSTCSTVKRKTKNAFQQRKICRGGAAKENKHLNHFVARRPREVSTGRMHFQLETVHKANILKSPKGSIGYAEVRASISTQNHSTINKT